MRASRGGVRVRHIHAALALSLALAAAPRRSHADEAAAPAKEAAEESAEPALTLRDLSGPPSRYAHLVGTFEFGKGVRFNNPYRLATQLGATAESASLRSIQTSSGVQAVMGLHRADETVR